MVPKETEEKIEEFVRRVREAAGENLEGVVLYGSAANGEFHEGFSDLNLFCILRDGSFASLRALAKVVKWWTGQKQPTPLIMTRGELECSTDVFAIELIDMKQHHKVLFGRDLISGLDVPMALHRVQVEYELREKLVLLRQAALANIDNERRLLEVMAQSVTSFLTLFRHALIALHEADVPVSRTGTIDRIKKYASDTTALSKLLEIREKKIKKVEVPQLFARYLGVIEQVTAAVDQALEPRA